MLEKLLYVFYLFEKPTLDFLNKKKNSLFISNIEQTNDSSIFKSLLWNKLYKKEENVRIFILNLLDSADLNKEIHLIINKAYNSAMTLSVENMPQLTDEIKESIYSTIDLCLLKSSHKKGDLFYWLADIFFKINVTHKLSNGNKRLATSLLITFLYTFGYYFKFIGAEFKERRDWEQVCCKVIERNDLGEPDESIILSIRHWIIKNIVIAVNTRK